MNSSKFCGTRSVSFIRHFAIVVVIGICALLASGKLALAIEVGGGCGSVNGMDYRQEKFTDQMRGTYKSVYVYRKLLEDAHFTPPVEMLLHGHSTIKPGGDISYLLQHIPNHPRALLAMIALGEKEKTTRPAQSAHSVECWLRRAVAFSPDDNTIKLIYAQYLFKEGRAKDAEHQLYLASTDAGDNPFTQNNIGLVYFDAKDYEKALVHAHKAYAAGYTNPFLRDQLKSVGKWVEPAVVQPVEPARNPP